MEYIFNATKLKLLKKNHLNISRVDSDINITNVYVEKNAKPWYIISGEFHYSRYDNKFWEEEILKIKAGGVNVIATYCFWNHHEYRKGNWNFDGDMNLFNFISLCQKHGMQVILRVGPYCHGEVVYGGFPKYVFIYPLKRTNNKKYLSWVKELYTRYYNQVSQFLYPNGCIIGLQIDNEYTGKYTHILELKKIAVEVGFKLPLYTVTAWSGELCEGEVMPLSGSYPEAPWEQNLKPLKNGDRFKIRPIYIDEVVGSDSDLYDNTPAEKRFFNSTPFGMCELGAGVQCTMHRRPIISTMDAYAMSFNSLAKGINILGYYIYHGGRNPNFAPMQETKRTLYPNNLPVLSYDFQAPIGEYGYPKEKYFYLKLLHYFCTTFDESFPVTQPVFMEKSFFDGNDKFSSSIRINEQGQGYHFINTYERGIKDNGTIDFMVKIKYREGIVSLPSITLSNGNCFFYPFNYKVGNITFKYITAQPILKFRNGNTVNLYFAKHKEITVKFETDQPIEVEGLGIKTCGDINALNREVISISDNGINYKIFIYDFDEILKLNYIIFNNSVEWSNNFLYYDEENIYEISEKGNDLSDKAKLTLHSNQRMPRDKYFYGRYKLRTYEMTFDKDIFDNAYDIKLTFSTNCDIAHIYCDGKMVADYMNINNNFEIYLRRIKTEILAGKKFIVKTRAIKPKQRTYYEIEIVRKDSRLSIKSLSAVTKKITRL